MGFAFTGLVPATLLYNNPGVTKEEFLELLDSVHVSASHEFSPEDPLGIHKESFSDFYFHRGLYGLAKILGLPPTEAYKKMREVATEDEHGLLIYPPHLDEWNILERKPKYRVIAHERNKVKEQQYLGGFSYDELEEGKIWFDPSTDQRMARVEKIIVDTYQPFEEFDGDEIDFYEETGINLAYSNFPQHMYICRVTPFREVWKSHRFRRLEDLYEKFPMFDPLFQFDFSQKEGLFKDALTGHVSWVQENGKYSLHPDTHEKLPASLRDRKGSGYGYTDLVLTSEAIGKKSWKLFSYGGTQHTEEFLETYPDSRKKLDKAVWDAQTSMYAKRREMTTTDFLRMRLEPLD